MTVVQRGALRTPKVGFFKCWQLWWKHRLLVMRLRQGDVLLEPIQAGADRESIFRLMGELTSASGREIALLRTPHGRVLRMGISRQVGIQGAIRVIAHTHSNGRIGLSVEDFLVIFLNPQRRHRSTIIIGPTGAWRRFSSSQEILGGNIK